MPSSCAKRVKPRRLSRILLGPKFEVQLTPAICARDGATELNKSGGLSRAGRQAGKGRRALQAVAENVAHGKRVLVVQLVIELDAERVGAGGGRALRDEDAAWDR